MRRERAEMWREVIASERRLIPDVPEGVCGGATVPWPFDTDDAEETDVDPTAEFRFLETGEGPDPALPWFRRKLLRTLAARAEMLTKQDDLFQRPHTCTREQDPDL